MINPLSVKQFLKHCLFVNSSLKTLFTGKKYLHHEVYAEEYNNHYMVSSQPILDENGNLFGGVAVIRDMKTVRQIYQKITGTTFY